MKFFPIPRVWFVALLAFSSFAATATPPPPPPDNVSVHYSDPQQFTETKRSFGVHLIDADAYLKPLKAYIAQRASRILAPGQRLDIEVTDVDLAGEYEPWHGPRFNDIRIIKSIYPPRIDLHFILYGADGKVLREGKRMLRDMSFLDRGSAHDQDSLRYEKSLIDQWLRKGIDKL